MLMPAQFSVPTFEPEQDACPFCEGHDFISANHRHNRTTSAGTGCFEDVVPDRFATRAGAKLRGLEKYLHAASAIYGCFRGSGKWNCGRIGSWCIAAQVEIPGAGGSSLKLAVRD